MAETLTATASEIKIIQWRNFRDFDRVDRFIESQVEIEGVLYELIDIRNYFSTAVLLGSDNPVELNIGYVVLEKKYRESHRR